MAPPRVVARPVNQELIDAHEQAKHISTDKKKVFEDLVAKLTQLQNDHCTSFEDFKDLGMESA